MERAVLVYDADCGFCRWSATTILAWDRRRRLRAVPLGSAQADELLRDLEPERRAASWHLVSASGVVSAGGAVAPLAHLLPGGAPIALLAEAFPGLVERMYQWVADHRITLTRLLGTRQCDVSPVRRAAQDENAAPR